MTKDTVTPKDIETQHLKLSNAVYRDFFVREMASLNAVIKLGAQSVRNIYIEYTNNRRIRCTHTREAI